MLVRLRLIGGQVPSASLESLVAVAERYGDGRVHVTSRANLQLRGFPSAGGGLPEEAVMALESTGLLPSRTHELVRNVMLSPQSGLSGGRLDLRSVGAELDERLRASLRLAELPGRFLFVLDDGRGDLLDRSCDLGLVALDGHEVQLRVGDGWAQTLPAQAAAARLAELAEQFMERRVLDSHGGDDTAAWHVRELSEPLTASAPAHHLVPPPSPALAFGEVPGGIHHAVPPTGLDRASILNLTSSTSSVIITPWRGVLVPKEHL